MSALILVDKRGHERPVYGLSIHAASTVARLYQSRLIRREFVSILGSIVNSDELVEDFSGHRFTDSVTTFG